MNQPLLSSLLLLSLLLPVRGAEPVTYKEKWRPQIHFTPAKNWMNDPNGMVYYDGEYHLFYQYNPWGDKWGHMSWGHAVSRDLTSWEHLPVALYEENDIMIFSGSAVVDKENTSGFGVDGKPPMVAIYTGHYTKKPLQNQHIAYSNDRGRTWTKYSGNPVLDIGEADFRDPKVMWDERTKQWVMTVAWPGHRKVRFYSSPNLKEWKHLSDFGPAGSTSGIWECPDLFPLKIEGGRGERWVLIVNVGGGAPAGGSGTQYFVGNFDGAHFTLDESYPKARPSVEAEGKLIADFEEGSYGEWKAEGDAFGKAPANGKIGGQQEVTGYKGTGLVNTFLNGDGSHGTLTSPEFTIEAGYISFLIGGGNHPGKTCMNLLIDGEIARTASGNDAEKLDWKSWDVKQFRGKRARLQIVDRETGGWGHVNVDQIFMGDKPGHGATSPALWADYGPDFYAAVSWSNVPRRDGRRLWLGWMSSWPYANDVPTKPWRSAMSLPRELVLRKTAEGLRMAQKPVKELGKVRTEKFGMGRGSLDEANDWLREHNVTGALWEIETEIEFTNKTGPFGLKVLQGPDQATVIEYNPSEKTIAVDRTKSGNTGFHPAFGRRYEGPVTTERNRIRLHIFIDTSSVEVFANDGQTVLTTLILPDNLSKPVELWSSGDGLKVRKLDVWKLKPAEFTGEGLETK